MMEGMMNPEMPNGEFDSVFEWFVIWISLGIGWFGISDCD